MVRRLLEIRRGEGRLVLLLGGHFFLFLAGQTLLSAVAKGLFLETFSAAALPYTYIGGSVATFLATAGYFQLRRLRPATCSVVTAVLLAAGLVALRLAAGPWPRGAVFLLATTAPAFGAVMGGEHAILTRSQLDSRSARRLFPALGTLGGIGATVAGFTVPGLRQLLPALDLFWLSAVLYLSTLAPRLQLKVKRARGAKVEPAPWRRILGHRYSLLLMAIVFCSSILPRLTDYQLGAALQEAYPGTDLSVFYGKLDGWISGISIVFTLFASRFLIGRLGVGTSGIVYPLAVVAAAAGGAVLPGVITATGLLASERLLRQNLQRPILSMTFMPLPEAMRARMALVTRGVLRPLATLTASGAILYLAPRIHWSAFAPGIAVLGGVVLVAALIARRDYVQELFRALHSRRLRLEDDEIETPQVLDAKIRQLLHDQLGSEYPEQVALALQLLRGRCRRDTVEIISERWRDWEPWVRTEAVRSLGEEPGEAALELLRGLGTGEPDEVLAAALQVPGVTPSPAELRELLETGSPLARATALVQLAGEFPEEQVAERVSRWADSGDPRLHQAAARVVAELESPDLLDHLPTLVRYAPAEVLRAIARHPRERFTELCVRALADDRLYAEARRALLAIGSAGLPVLLRFARDRDRSAQTLNILGELEDPRSRQALVELLEAEDEELRFRAARALATRPDRLEEDEREQVRQALRREIGACRRARASTSGDHPVLRQELAGDFDWALERALMLLVLLDPRHPYRRIYLSLISDDAEDRSFAIEALDEMLEPEWKRRLLPLLEGETTAAPAPEAPADGWLARLREVLARAEEDPSLALAIRLKECPLLASWRVRDLLPLAEAAWRPSGGEPPAEDEPYLLIRDGEAVELERTILSGDSPSASGDGEEIAIPLKRVYRTVARRPRCAAAWLRGLADRLAAPGGPGEDVSRTALMSLASRTVVRDHDQADDLDLWRRIFFLRTVEILSGLSSERLRLVAEIARPLAAAPGEVILREGRLGNHFYLVCTGTAEVLAGERRTAVLNPSDAFGALALLSGRGRTATVKALERCELLSIERTDFLDLTDAHPALARAFSRLIAEYARASRA